MNKLLLCAALLAMSYIVSADVTVYNLPLNKTAFAKNTTFYKAQTAQSTDGKFYYGDFALDGSPIVQVWDSKTQTNSDAINITNLQNQVNNFGYIADGSILLESLGNTPYFALGYDNITDFGVEMFLVQSDPNAPNYTLTSTVGDSGDTMHFIARSCETTDGKFYYYDEDVSGNPLLQVWDSASKTQGNSISLVNLMNQTATFLTNLNLSGALFSSYYLQCLGTTVYLNLAYSNLTNTGMQMFVVQVDANATNYPVPLELPIFPFDLNSFLTLSCGTADGKYHYLDSDVATQFAGLKEWDFNTQTATNAVNMTDVYNAQQTFFNTLGPNAKNSTLIQCIGNDVYLNAAWKNDTAAGVQLYLLKKSAGILSFSFGAFFVALVALLF